MKVSREQMAEHRVRILEAASRLFREKGFEAVTVAEVMKAAGLTHGGFYGHFASKDDLVAQSLAYAFKESLGKMADPCAFIDDYLSPKHRDNPGKGCPTAGLAAETRHESATAQAAMTAGLRQQIDGLSRALSGESDAERRREAIGGWAAMVGAVILARAVDDPAFSDEVLNETRAWIDANLNG